MLASSNAAAPAFWMAMNWPESLLSLTSANAWTIFAWPATKGRRLRKTRYEIPWKNLKIEIDIYHGRNHGLVVAEVEFPNHASCRRFKPPRWFGREITGEKRYSNVRLARE